MHTHAEIKRLVIGDRKTSRDTVRLFLAEHDGELYATNSYWLTPATAVRSLLEHNNLPADQPGVYDVNSKLSAQDLEPPKVGALIPNLTDADIIHRSRLNGEGSPLFVKPWRVLLALFDRTDDGQTTQVAFDASYLAFIDNDGEVGAIPCGGYGSRLVGEPIYRQGGPGKPMTVHAKREKKSGGHNGHDGKYVAETWADDGEQFLGLLMPVKVG